MQIYGYFVEWYYGKKAYAATIVTAVVFGHFFSAVLQTTSISTTSSALTMAIIALKLYFLWEYRHYRKLKERRTFLYILLGLIVAINLIPVFVVNNVDYSAHLGTTPHLFRWIHSRSTSRPFLPKKKDRLAYKM